MKKNLSSGLRITLLIYAILMALYALPHLFFPEIMGTDSAANRLVGAAALAFGLGAALAWLDSVWDHVRIVIEMQIAWTVLYTLALLWDIVIGGSDPALLPPAVIVGIFAVLFILFYFRQGRITHGMPAHT